MSKERDFLFIDSSYHFVVEASENGRTACGKRCGIPPNSRAARKTGRGRFLRHLVSEFERFSCRNHAIDSAKAVEF